VLLGETLGGRSPATTASQPVIAEIHLESGGRFVVPNEIEDVAVYVIEGGLAHGDERFAPRTLVVRRPGAALAVHADAGTRLLLVGGPRLEGQVSRDPRHIEWNFVATTKERIQLAKKRWRERAFPEIPGDSDERIPLPDERH
jgi:redox-sensitive bicupin YhaK (pirin superfamily)